MLSFWNQIGRYWWFGNSGQDYLTAVALFICTLVVLKIFQVIILTRLNLLAKKTSTDLDDTLIDIFRNLKPPFYLLVSLFVGFRALHLPDLAFDIVNVIFIIVVVYEIVRGFDTLISYILKKYLAKEDQGDKDREHTEAMIRTLVMIFKVVIWVIGIIIILSNIGINVTSLVASLGIGGIAVALAIQNILSDLFSSFSIYMDKPFQVGDFIAAGTDMGTVEKIGLKSTRIRSISGEQLVISNKELTSARVQNYGQMERRRIVFTLGVTYNTAANKLEAVPGYIKEIVDKYDMVDFDRCHFKEYADSSLNFETVFYVNSSEYTEYMDVRQKINMDIFKKFAEVGIEFAYPTQTVYVNK